MSAQASLLRTFLRLRGKQLLRLQKGIGLPRTLFLVALAGFLLAGVFRTSHPWAVPAIVLAGILAWHNERKDKDFLAMQTGQAVRLLRAEYLLLALPFFTAEMLKGHWAGAACMFVGVCLIPRLKSIRRKSVVWPLPLLYRGGMEYRRMYRQWGWAHLLLTAASLAGALHGNMRVAVAGMLLWGFLQTVSFASTPRPEEKAMFAGAATLQKYLLFSSSWNATVTWLPLAGMLLFFQPTGKSLLLAVSTLSGSILCLWHLGMLRQFRLPGIGMAVYVLCALLPLFFYGCWAPLLHLPLLAANLILSFLIKHKFKKTWN